MGVAFLSFWCNLGEPFLGLVYLLGWSESFIGKERKKVGKAGSLCVFWSAWKARNDIAFGDEVLSIQSVKFFFCMSSLVEE